MIKYYLIAFVVFLLPGIAWPIQNTESGKSTDELEVKFVGTSTKAFVIIKFQTIEKSAYILYCADNFDGTKYLCPLQGSDLEVLTRHGWQRVKQKSIFGTLGPPSRDVVFSALIEPHSETTFRFEFSRDYFEVEPEQQLRVVIDTWVNERSMKNGDEAIKLHSQPFECPKIGISP